MTTAHSAWHDRRCDGDTGQQLVSKWLKDVTFSFRVLRVSHRWSRSQLIAVVIGITVVVMASLKPKETLAGEGPS